MEGKKRRHGPTPRPVEELRTERLSVYFTLAEYVDLAELAGATDLTGQTRTRRIGRYVRDQALHRTPPTVPEINRQAWLELARSASNLSQAVVFARREENQKSIYWLKQRLAEFRSALIGTDLTPQEEEEDESESN